MTNLDDVLPLRDRSMGEPRSIGSLDGSVKLHIDIEAYDFHIDAKPDYDPVEMCSILTQAGWWGLTLMEEDQAQPEFPYEDDDTVRRYLTPLVPIEDVQPFSRWAKQKGLDMASAAVLPLTGAAGILAMMSGLLQGLQ